MCIRDSLGEEDGPIVHPGGASPASGVRAPFRWIVDPLDGTANYVHGLQSFAVSIALENAGQLVAGTVYAPIMDELSLIHISEPTRPY